MSIDAALNLLPAPTRALFEEALALSAAWPKNYTLDDMVPAHRLVAQAMAGIGLPDGLQAPGSPADRKRAFSDRYIVPAEALCPVQRALMVALVDRSDLFRNAFPVPGSAHSRRQWLGLIAPGPLWVLDEATGRPLFHTIVALATADRDHNVIKVSEGDGRKKNVPSLHQYLLSLPIAVRAPILGELDLIIMDCWGKTDALLLKAANTLDTTVGGWARDYADRVLEGGHWIERTKGNHERSALAFAALVASGETIEPRDDALLRLPREYIDDARLDAWISAIPAERRAAAVVQAIEAEPFPTKRIWIALEVVKRWPLDAIVIYVEANKRASKDANKEATAVLKGLLAAHPHLKKAVAAWKASIPKPLNLQIKDKKTLKAMLPLSDAHAAQLVTAASAYDGHTCSAEAIVNGQCGLPEPIIPNTIKYMRLEGARGKPSYELWTMMSDSGTFFVAGTTDIAARIVQGSVDGDDPHLTSALSFALSGAK